MIRMRVVLRKSISVVADYAEPIWRFQVLPPGELLLEEIGNPTGMGDPWLVVQGTRSGVAKEIWEEHLNGKGGK